MSSARSDLRIPRISCTVSKYSSLWVFTPVKKKCSSSEMRFMTASERSSPVDRSTPLFSLSAAILARNWSCNEFLSFIEELEYEDKRTEQYHGDTGNETHLREMIAFPLLHLVHHRFI